MKKLNFKGAALALLFAGIVMSISAQPQRQNCSNPERRLGCENFIPDLSDEQKASIENLRTPHIKAMNANRVKMNVLKAELRELEIADKTDQGKINNKIDEVAALKAKMMKERSSHRQQVRSLLSDDQKVIFDAHGPKRGCCKKQYGPHGKGRRHGGRG